jgi:hypothetical protein
MLQITRPQIKIDMRLIRISDFVKVSMLVILIGLGACGIKENNKVEPETLVRIYNNNSYSDSYNPIDVTETTDGGYLMVVSYKKNETDFANVYILKVDAKGDFVRETRLPDEYVNPIKGFLQAESAYYFFCMDRLTLGAKLIQVFDDGSFNEVAALDIIYPLASSYDAGSGQFLLLSYDREDKNTIVSKINKSGSVTGQVKFEIGFGDFDAEESIIKHFSGTGKKLPFFCGTLENGLHYFNGYYRYTMSLVSFQFGSSTPKGLVYGYKDERALNAMASSESTISVSKYEYGSVYFIPNFPKEKLESGISVSSDLSGFPIPELKENTEVILKNVQIKGRDVIVFGSNSRGGQIALYFYDRNSSELLGTKYLGFTNPYEVSGISTTSKGGLVITGKTWISNRFSRICLFRLSADEINGVF